MKRIVIDNSYEKVADSKRILARQSVLTAGQHSRSFRRFLRLVGVPVYSGQSRSPA
jgi:hypothetical protein